MYKKYAQDIMYTRYQSVQKHAENASRQRENIEGVWKDVKQHRDVSEYQQQSMSVRLETP